MLKLSNEKMREHLDAYRHARNCIDAIELAQLIEDHVSELEDPGDALFYVSAIRSQVGADVRTWERKAKRAKDIIVEANEGLITIVARATLGVAAKNAENLAEAKQEGAMGVMRAVDAFDPDRGLWSICARHWIRYYVQTCAHHQTDFPRQRHQRMPPEVAKAANIIRAKFGREPKPEELTWKGQPVTPMQWRDWTERTRIVSFDSAASGARDENDDAAREEVIADESTDTELSDAAEDLHARINKVLSEMSPRNRAALAALLIEGEPLQEVAERFSIPPNRVAELRQVLTSRLKSALSADLPS